MSILSNIINGIPIGKTGLKYNPLTFGSVGSGISFLPRTQTLPNGNKIQGITTSRDAPTPTQQITPDPVQVPTSPSPVSQSSPIFHPVQNSAGSVPSQFIDKNTGGAYSPREYAKKMNGDIPQYAGDALTQGNQSAEQLQSQVAGLNNTRNDITTGTTDPYKVASKSGIAYSPTELKAIENAYAGIYDPAINSALAKLDAKQKRDEQIFVTNESIRRWKATSGTKDSLSSNTSFSDNQSNKGASRMGVSIKEFKTMDPDLKNFFINTPKAKDVNGLLGPTDTTVSMDALLNAYIEQVANGQMSSQEVKNDIANSKLPKSVKHYFIVQVPGDKKSNPGFFKRIWNAL